MATILIADNDKHILDVVRYALEKAGHTVIEASNGREALEVCAKNSIELAVLDIVMPIMDGIDTFKELQSKYQVPAIFLSSRDDEIDRVLGLELGADDYITKPFSPRELTARVKSVLRRLTPKVIKDDAVKLEWNLLSLDVEKHICRFSDEIITLTATEFALLGTLMGFPGKVYSRAELVDKAYGYDHNITDRTVDSHIRRIRKKLADVNSEEIIQTVHGVGYKLKS